MTLETVLDLIQMHPFVVLLPLAIIEGPIVTVIAAWMLKGSLPDLVMVYILCVAGDVMGDAGFYGLGRQVHRFPRRWRERLGLSEARLSKVSSHFDDHGPATLAFGKLTHSAGMAVLLAAGAAHMPFGRYIGWNFIASLPKTLILMLIGIAFGAAYEAVDVWIFRGSLLALFPIVLAAGLVWFNHKRHKRTPS